MVSLLLRALGDLEKASDPGLTIFALSWWDDSGMKKPGSPSFKDLVMWSVEMAVVDEML